MFEAAGFERIAIRRMIYPDRRYVAWDEAADGKPGVERSKLQGRFANASDADIRTAAAHYLYRKL
jgi:hypothetical protein